MSWPDYKGKTIGFAKVMGELPISNGTLAYEIMNFTSSDTGFLENKFKILPLIPNEWNLDEKNFKDFQPPEFNRVLAMKYMKWDGESPELLFLTTSGVFLFVPGNRTGAIPYGSSGAGDTSSNGLIEQFQFTKDNAQRSVVPQSSVMYPPQMETVGNRVYFTYCDGGGAYVWDGVQVRQFGYTMAPSAPSVLGPTPTTTWSNDGGFSDGGRIGTLNYNLTSIDSSGVSVTTGGLEAGLWFYWVVFESQDGAYSEASERGGRTTIQYHVAKAGSDYAKYGISFLRRRFWVQDLPKGPPGTVARIILRTMNLNSLPAGASAEPRFLHRIPNNTSEEYMDDIPDSELGGVWGDRRSVPVGFYFMKFFSGSMFLMATEQYPARVWWSEQGIGTDALPESFMADHWRDVFPETGKITGSLSVSIGGSKALLIFKEAATHVVSGAYPQPGTSGWEFGTISTIAGCAGPNLSQSAPDGSIIWYGNGTFWLLSPGEKGFSSPVDIGLAVRKRLSKINPDKERFGSSWINKKNKEITFVLPYKDSSAPDLQFVWDYQNRGWRLRQDLLIDAVELVGDMTLISGSWKGRVGNTGFNTGTLLSESTETTPTNTVWVYQKGSPNYDVGSELTSTYTTGWMNFTDFGPEFHVTHHTVDSVFILEERSARKAIISTYSDWNFDDKVSSDLEIALIHPENNNIQVYDGTDDKEPEVSNGESSLFSSDTAVYRDIRTYTHRLPVDIVSSTVFSFSLNCSAIDDPMALISIDAFGPPTSLPGSRSPNMYEGSK